MRTNLTNGQTVIGYDQESHFL